jgi:hypothetical protein
MEVTKIILSKVSRFCQQLGRVTKRGFHILDFEIHRAGLWISFCQQKGGRGVESFLKQFDICY